MADRSRLNEGDAHVPGRDLLAQRLTEGPDAVLGGVVHTAVEPGHPSRHRADVDDVGHRARLALGCAQQVRQGGVGAVEEAQYVQLDHPLPLFDRGVDDRAEQHDARVVDQGVQAAQLAHRAADGVLGLGLISDVGLDHEGRGAGRRSARPAPRAGRGDGPPMPPPRPPRPRRDAVASPMPLLAPVTRATVPSSLLLMRSTSVSSRPRPGRPRFSGTPRRGGAPYLARAGYLDEVGPVASAGAWLSSIPKSPTGTPRPSGTFVGVSRFSTSPRK